MLPITPSFANVVDESTDMQLLLFLCRCFFCIESVGAVVPAPAARHHCCVVEEATPHTHVKRSRKINDVDGRRADVIDSLRRDNRLSVAVDKRFYYDHKCTISRVNRFYAVVDDKGWRGKTERKQATRRRQRLETS